MFRLKTFGGLCLQTGSAVAGGRGAQRRRLALLARLAAAHGAPVSRDKLVALLWPEQETVAARHALAQAVYEIRRTLGEPALAGSPADALRLDPQVVASDVADFHRALERGDLHAATAVYAGPFLDGFFVDDAPEFERWVEVERTQLARACAAALHALARDAAASGDRVGEAKAWRRLSEHEPLEPAVTLATMRALVAVGDRPGAVREAARHATALRVELDLPPDPNVEALAAELRSGARATPPPPRPAVAPPPQNRRRVAVLAAAAVLLVGGLGVATQLTVGVDDHQPRSVVLGSVTSNDAAFGLAIREAFRAELDATSHVRALTDAGLRDALRLMALPAETVITGELAVEIAQRGGISLAVVGSAVTVGDGAELTVRVLDAGTGRIVWSAAAHPREAGEVLDAVSRLARTVRERVAGIRVDSLPPLPAVTTRSLPALRNYVLARGAAGEGNRAQAIALAEAALVHDSTFALAHYLVGDLLWYTDAQRRSQYHLAEAFRWSGPLPPRERLVVRARYEQLVADRPDSALAVWRLLRRTYPGDPLAPEGMAWAYRALGDFPAAAAVADTALQLDPGALFPNVSNRMHALLAAGDTATARAALPLAPHWMIAVELFAAVMRDDHAAAERVLRDAYPGEADAYAGGAPYWWQLLELARGRLPEAERAMTTIVRRDETQHPPRALLSQARAELALGGSAEHAAALAREAFDWMRRADLSPPAYARIAERIADVAARSRDLETLRAVQEFIRREDAGRGLPSYRMADETIQVCRAFAAREFTRAVVLARRTRTATYFWRPMSVLLLLEADALAALGDGEAARAVYRTVLSWPVPLDADYETWMALRAVAARAIERVG